MSRKARILLQLVFYISGVLLPVSSIDSIFLLPSQCGTVQPADVGIIIRSNDNENYTLQAENCSYVMTATSPTHRIRFAFNTGNGETGFLNNPANNGTSSCPGASIEIFDGPDVSSPSLSNKLCGDLDSDELLSSGNTLTLLLQSSDNATAVNFTAHYTSFTEETDCGSDLRCSNGRCVSVDMRCDATRINNCGDFSDNFAGPPGNCSSETTTTDAGTTTVQTSTPTTTVGDNVGVYIAVGIIGGILLIYLHWLLFKPRWLIWRICWFGKHGCYRSISSCLGRNVVNSTPSMDKIGSSTTDTRKRSSLESTPREQSKLSAYQECEGESPFVRGIAKEQHIFTVNHGDPLPH